MTDKEANDIAEAMYDKDPVYEFERLHWEAYQREKEECETTSDYGLRSFFHIPTTKPERVKTPIDYAIMILIAVGLGVLLSLVV